MTKAVLLICLIAFVVGCTSSPTQFSFLIGGYVGKQGENCTIPAKDFDKLWATRLPDIKVNRLSSDVHYSTAIHRGEEIKFFSRESPLEMYIYVEHNGKTVRFPGDWLCAAPILTDSYTSEEFEEIIRRLQEY